MKTPQRSPIQELKLDQSSMIASQNPYRQAQFNFRIPKIDHAFITENYRRLRIQQRSTLTQLRMPDHLKRKIFDFKEDEDLKHEKPDLVIFNHPFRGRMVMTRNEVELQLQRERRNAQIIGEKQFKGDKVPENILNDMGLQQQKLNMKVARMQRQPSQAKQQYPKKPRLVSNQPEKQIAESVNDDLQQKKRDRMYFIHKDKQEQETEKERTQKMRRLKEQKQMRRSVQKQKSKSKDMKKTKLSDMPIIGEQPKVVRDIKYQNDIPSRKNIYNEQTVKSTKGYYRPFGNDNEIREFDQVQKNTRYGASKNLSKRKQNDSEQQYPRQLDKSMSQISSIASNDVNDDFSNAQSQNKQYFLD